MAAGVVAVACGAPSSATADEKRKSEPPLIVTGKWGKGVRADTPDGAYGLSIGARAQVRASATVSDEDDVDPAVEVLVRRMRLTVEGHAFHDLVTFKLQLAFAPADSDPVAPGVVRDAFLTFSPHDYVELRFGQQKVPFGRQRVVSSGSQQLVDRSIVTGELNLDRDVGLVAFSNDLFGLDELLGYRLGVFGGDGRNVPPGESIAYGLLYTGRVEVRASGGGVGMDSESDLSRTSTPRLTIGASAAYNQDTDRDRSTIGKRFATGPWADYVHVGADAAFQWSGFSITSEFFYRDAVVERRTAVVEEEEVTDIARTGYGGFVQLGQMIGAHLELAARAGTLLRSGDPESGIETKRELGGGVNFFVLGHALKIQTDAFRVQGTAEGSGETQVRLQLQAAP